jgi:glutamyl-tRNA synthetase
MSEQIRTRFAPSPTGFLHVGGARTALFNYLYVHRYGGQFRLRIEDTDQKRSNREMIRMILDGLKWLGIHWNDEIIFQGANFRRHLEIANVLLENKKAYPCFCSKEELEIHRKEFRYDGHCRRLTVEEIAAKKAMGIPYSIRFKVPEGETSWEDEIHGTISFKNEEIEDFVIVRSDNSPTYNLAVVTDDFDMGINLVIRGDDHISNTPKQILLYRSNGWKIPRFAHVPLILGPDGKRLSKRHGAASVEEYKQKGILSKALFNFLAILGWSPQEGKELLSFQEIIDNFSLSSVSKKSAVFDEKKLAWMNQQYILQASAVELFGEVSSRWLQKEFINSENIKKDEGRLLRIIELLKPRAVYLADFVDLAEYFFIQPQNFDRKGFRKYLSDEQNWVFLAEITAKLMAADDFRSDHLEKIFRQYAEEINISAGKVIHPVRLALTGRTASPGLFDVMELLGGREVIQRLNYFLKKKEFFQKELTE